MRKELTVFISTNEEGEEIKINRVTSDPGFFLMTLGQNRMVINGQELIEALQSIDHYGVLFDQEQKMRELRAASPPPKSVEITPVKKVGKAAKLHPEDEGALVLEAQIRTGPTASELALEAQTKHMQGGSLVFREKE